MGEVLGDMGVVELEVDVVAAGLKVHVVAAVVVLLEEDEHRVVVVVVEVNRKEEVGLSNTMVW